MLLLLQVLTSTMDCTTCGVYKSKLIELKLALQPIWAMLNELNLVGLNNVTNDLQMETPIRNCGITDEHINDVVNTIIPKNGKRKNRSPIFSVDKRSRVTSFVEPGTSRICVNEVTPNRNVPKKPKNLQKLAHAPVINLAKTIFTRTQVSNLHAKSIPLAPSNGLHRKSAPSAQIESNLTKSVHVTRFTNDTTCDDILNHLRTVDCTRNIVDQIQCTRLTRSDRHISNYKFISFKLTFPRQYFDRIVSASTWPCDVAAKEFIVKTRTQSSVSAPSASRVNFHQQSKNGAHQNGYPETMRSATQLIKESNRRFNPFALRQTHHHRTKQTPLPKFRGNRTNNQRFH